MAKHRQTKKQKIVNSTENKTAKLKQEAIRSFVEQVDNEIIQMKNSADKIIRHLEEDMRKRLCNIPNRILKMTVEEYCQQYVLASEQDEEKENAPENDIWDIKEESVPNNVVIQVQEPASTLRGNRASKRVSKRVSKKSSMAKRRKVTETPMGANHTRTPFNFRMVEGTPLLTIAGARKPSLFDKPLTTRKNANISTIQLSLFSERGSPMSGSNMSEDVLKKAAEGLLDAAEQLRKQQC